MKDAVIQQAAILEARAASTVSTRSWRTYSPGNQHADKSHHIDSESRCPIESVHSRLGPDRDIRDTLNARHRAHRDAREDDRPTKSRHSRLGPGYDVRDTLEARPRYHRGAGGDNGHGDDSDCRIMGQRRSPTPPSSTCQGQKPFGPRIRDVVFPPRFCFTVIDKYTGETRPGIWLADYQTACRTNGGNDYVAIHYLPLYLADSARTWLTNPELGRPRDTLRQQFPGHL